MTHGSVRRARKRQITDRRKRIPAGLVARSAYGADAAPVGSPIYVAAPVDVFDLDEVRGVSDGVHDSVVTAARRVGPFQLSPQWLTYAMGVGSERPENELDARGSDLVG